MKPLEYMLFAARDAHMYRTTKEPAMYFVYEADLSAFVRNVTGHTNLVAQFRNNSPVFEFCGKPVYSVLESAFAGQVVAA